MGSSQSSYATTNNNVVDSSSTNKKNRLLKNSSSTRGRKSSNNNSNSNNISKSTTTSITSTTDKVTRSQGISAPHGLRSSVVSMTPSSATDENPYGSDANIMLDTTSIESVHSDYEDDHHYHHDTNVNLVPDAIKPTTVTWNKNHEMETTDDEEDTEESSDEDDEDVWDEDEEERQRIMEDVRRLKFMAKAFLHPEIPMADVTSLWASGMECARCYYDRYSFATEQEMMKERDMILDDASRLKKYATDYLHPEIPMVTTDATSFGRNYFTRYDAPGHDDDEENERAMILQDAIAMKQAAMDYLHPEIPMMNTSIGCARNYFTRYSASEYNDSDTSNERNQILQDVVNLKKYAADYLHPETPMMTTDATSFGRNYFTRYSAPMQDSYEAMLERDSIFRDIQLLQQVAKDYLHPELPVTCNDPTVFGRNYFMRASAPEQVSYEDTKIAEQILDDANAFHQLAVEYLHPELPIVIYATASGRNYFSRASGPMYESLDDVQTRTQIMDDLKAFKSLASNYLHPELPIVIYSTSFGRNYFTRPGAEEYTCLEEMEEREHVLADANALKQSAIHFLHPEIPVVTTDGTACGRNYFSRYSAPECTDINERDLILADAKALKKLAVDYMHPELPVVTTDGTACGRNYFSRFTAEETISSDDEVERAMILSDAAALKKLAVDYMHPELPVVTTDGTAYGRNYFNRYNAARTFDDEMERKQILEEAAALKKLAVDYMHPELPVKSSVPCTRNYYDRASFTLHYHMIHTFPAHDDDDDDENSDHHHNEHIDHFGLMDEEMEMYNDLRAELEAYPIIESNANNRSTSKYGTTINKADSEVGSNLSRSPSSVFLFGLDD